MGKVSKAAHKISPYAYLARVHTRSERPKKYLDYIKYKPHLVKEFSRQCVYCRKVMLPNQIGSFVVEHFKPKKKFPELRNDYDNLLLACDRCNILKGEYWSDELEKKTLNPCNDILSQHLRFKSDAEIEALTERGSVNLGIFKPNEPEAIRFRKLFSTAIMAAVDVLKDKKTNSKNSKVAEKREDLMQLICEYTCKDREYIARVLKISP